ncbi:MAG TPA: glycosyltransferase family 4 protein [Candidatus Acidoferrum sp.]|nr:glycosyltransferase family 4 protein [Candidatus Acidoferrum sp.]
MVRVLSVQTTLLGNRTYGELLRRMLPDVESIEFHAEWNPEPSAIRIPGLKRFFWTRNPLRAVRERNLDFYTARYELGTSFLARGLAKRRCAELHPDVLHLHSQNLALLAGPLARRIPIVITADMTAYQTAEQTVARRWRWTYSPNARLEGVAFRAAAAVVTFSHWAARSVITQHGVDPSRVHVIPPGVERRLFAGLDAARERTGPLRMLFVGGEFNRKGGPLLVRTFLRGFGERDDVELHIVSGQAQVPKHPRIVVHRDVAPYSPAWHDLYAAADLFVLPTLRDASPHVVVEAMAAGLPVVATPVGSIVEMVDDGRTGILVAPGDEASLARALVTLLDDVALRRRFGSAGAARVVESFDAQINARALARVFVSAAGSAGQTGRSANPTRRRADAANLPIA